MGDYHVDGPNTPCVRSPEEMAGRFQAELMTALSGWKERLGANPDHLVELEQQIHAAFSRGADLLIVGLMAVVTNAPEFAEACGAALAQRMRPCRWAGARAAASAGPTARRSDDVGATSLYCAPRKGWFRSNERKNAWDARRTGAVRLR